MYWSQIYVFALITTILNFYLEQTTVCIFDRGGVEDTRLEAKDTKKFRGQGQALSRPRTKANCSPKKKGLQKFFSGDFKKTGLKNFFSGEKGLQKTFLGDFHLRKAKKGLRKFSARFLAFSNKILTVQKIVLSSSRGQAIFKDLRLRGQGLQNVSSRTPPLIFNSLSYKYLLKNCFSLNEK